MVLNQLGMLIIFDGFSMFGLDHPREMEKARVPKAHYT